MPEIEHERHARDRFRLRPGEVLGILVFWAFLAALTATGRLLDPRTPERPEITTALISLAFIEYSLWAALTVPIAWMANRLSRETENQALRILAFIGIGVVIAIAVDTTLLQARIHLLPAFSARAQRRVGFGNIIRFEFLDDLMVYFAVLGAALARNYFLRYQLRLEETQTLKAEAALLQARLAEAQLAVLRTQLNPHFLFNTLHAISSLVERDPRGVRRMIARLSELLRHTLEQSSEQEVPLDRELELLGRYLDIMEVRFQDRLNVTQRIDDDVRTALVPNLVLQPLVENALKHGVTAIDGPGHIEIAARRQGDTLVLSVRDNGPGPLSPKSSGLGLRNTTARLSQLYGDRQRFSLRAAPGGGTVAEVTLPYRSAGAA
jgi:two-component system, LytTR family, sensor kinase